jgi:hypothetical protein
MNSNRFSLVPPKHGTTPPSTPRPVRRVRLIERLPPIDPDLPFHRWPERIPEVLAYEGRKFLYWLSPRGMLQAWLRMYLLLSLYLAIPLFLILPVLQWAFASLDTSSVYMRETVTNLHRTLVEFFKLAALVAFGLALLKSITWLAKAGLIGSALVLAALLSWWHGWWSLF